MPSHSYLYKRYFAISSIGAVLHTLNPRLFEEQLVYIVNHAEDYAIFVDAMLYPILAKSRAKLTNVKHIIIMTDKEHMPPNLPADVLCYEELIAPFTGEFEWPEFDERTASSLCYTSVLIYIYIYSVVDLKP